MPFFCFYIFQQNFIHPVAFRRSLTFGRPFVLPPKPKQKMPFPLIGSPHCTGSTHFRLTLRYTPRPGSSLRTLLCLPPATASPHWRPHNISHYISKSNIIPNILNHHTSTQSIKALFAAGRG